MLTIPITGVACCADTTSGHAAAVPPIKARKSRRFTSAPRNQNYAPYRVTAVRLLEWRERDLNCDQLFRAVNVRSGSKMRRTRIEHMLSAYSR
jgi:hypothetical protein